MNETSIKSQVKEYLALRGIFSFPLTQGLGSYRGLPDRVAHYKGEVLYFELKTPKGNLSEWQENFKAQCEADGIKYFVIRSLEDLIDITETING